MGLHILNPEGAHATRGSSVDDGVGRSTLSWEVHDVMLIKAGDGPLSVNQILPGFPTPSSWPTHFGIVQKVRGAGSAEDPFAYDVLVYPPLPNASCLRAVNLGSLLAADRERKALQALWDKYPRTLLFDALAQPSKYGTPEKDTDYWAAVEPLLQDLAQNLNDGQMTALRSALARPNLISLIKGDVESDPTPILAWRM